MLGLDGGKADQMRTHLVGGFAVYTSENGGNAAWLLIALLQGDGDAGRASPRNIVPHTEFTKTKVVPALNGFIYAGWVGESLDADAGEFGAYGIS